MCRMDPIYTSTFSELMGHSRQIPWCRFFAFFLSQKKNGFRTHVWTFGVTLTPISSAVSSSITITVTSSATVTSVTDSVTSRPSIASIPSTPWKCLKSHHVEEENQEKAEKTHG